jgi:hypothetical protein
MSKTKLNVLFKKIQKDDKKEVLEFHVQGDELPHSQELVQMAGSIVVLEVKDSKAESFSVEFKSIQRDSKKTTLKFNVKGDSDEKIIKLYPMAGRNVTVFLQPSQMSADEFNDDGHEGVAYQVHEDGTATVKTDQLTLDDVEEVEDDLVSTLPGEDPFGDDDLLN